MASCTRGLGSCRARTSVAPASSRRVATNFPRPPRAKGVRRPSTRTTFWSGMGPPGALAERSRRGYRRGQRGATGSGRRRGALGLLRVSAPAAVPRARSQQQEPHALEGDARGLGDRRSLGLEGDVLGDQVPDLLVQVVYIARLHAGLEGVGEELALRHLEVPLPGQRPP